MMYSIYVTSVIRYDIFVALASKNARTSPDARTTLLLYLSARLDTSAHKPLLVSIATASGTAICCTHGSIRYPFRAYDLSILARPAYHSPFGNHRPAAYTRVVHHHITSTIQHPLYPTNCLFLHNQALKKCFNSRCYNRMSYFIRMHAISCASFCVHRICKSEKSAIPRTQSRTMV